MLTPTGWHFLVGDAGNQSNPNNYRQTFTNTSFGTTSPIGTTGLMGVSSKSTSYTMGMTALAITDTASYGLNPLTNLRVGKTLTMKAKVQLTNVQGRGVSLVIRGDKGTKTSTLFSSTPGRTPILGTADLRSIRFPCPTLSRSTGACCMW